MIKKLPSAIARTIDDMRREPEVWGESGEQVAKDQALPVRARAGRPDRDAPVVPAPEPRAAAAPRRDVAIAPPAPEAARAVVAAPAASEDTATALRRSQAREIVERHATYAAAGGLIPLPVADLAGVTAIIVHMADALAKHYQVPARRDRTPAIVMGILAGVAPVSLGAITSASLMRLVPGANLLGLAVTSIAAAACTRSVGRVLLEHFESGGTLLDFSADGGAGAG